MPATPITVSVRLRVSRAAIVTITSSSACSSSAMPWPVWSSGSAIVATTTMTVASSTRP
jgi:hypothetical protein